ncbi:MAG: YbaK/EbsC family protein, partial [Thermoplasmata archaeon]
VEQERATYRCIDSADERGVSTKQIVKSMIIKSDEDFVQCLVPGHLELDSEKLASLLGDFEMAGAPEVEAASGQGIGTVHPFAGDLRRLLDRRVLENEAVSFTTGDPRRGVIIARDDFHRALGGCEVVDICSDPEEYFQRLADEHGIGKHEARFLVESESLRYFEEVALGLDVALAVEWLRRLIRLADAKGKTMETVKPEWFTDIVEADLTEYAKKDLLIMALETGEKPVLRRGAVDLDSVVEGVLGENAVQVEQYRQGDEKVLNFLIGQVMKASRGAFDPRGVREKLLEKLG